jgi:F-type H+-transporting ATPase subunit b
MQIDWFTLIAQIVNFLILIALLRHFLYGRIVNAIDEREEKIASRWEQADKEKDKAEHQAQSHRQKSDELERQKDEILSKARQEAEDEKKEMIRNARDQVKELEKKWREGIEQQKQAFFHQLQSKLCEQVTAITRRFLKGMADVELEAHILQNFIKRAEDSDEKKSQLREFVNQYGDDLKVLTSFEIGQKDREKLKGVLHQVRGKKLNVSFERSSDLICGLSLQSNGRKIDFSAASYVNELQNRFSGLFAESSQESDQNEP